MRIDLTPSILVLTIQAYETQAEYVAKLRSRAQQMQQHVEDAAQRCASKVFQVRREFKILICCAGLSIYSYVSSHASTSSVKAGFLSLYLSEL
jgi:hypothetical protein